MNEAHVFIALILCAAFAIPAGIYISNQKDIEMAKAGLEQRSVPDGLGGREYNMGKTRHCTDGEAMKVQPRAKPCLNCKNTKTYHGDEYQKGKFCSPACQVAFGNSLADFRPLKKDKP